MTHNVTPLPRVREVHRSRGGSWSVETSISGEIRVAYRKGEALSSRTLTEGEREVLSPIMTIPGNPVTIVPAKVQKEIHREAMRARLREIICPGDTVYTILEHVSKSGMLREVRVLTMVNNRPWDLSYMVSILLDIPQGKTRGLRMAGCGIDMGFQLVYLLSGALFGYHHEGEYALRQVWL